MTPFTHVVSPASTFILPLTHQEGGERQGRAGRGEGGSLEVGRVVARHARKVRSCLHDNFSYKGTLNPTGGSRTPTFLFILPAEGVLAADHSQLQTVGFLFIFIRAIRHYCLPAPLCTALRLAGTEEKPVAKLGWHAIQEGPQRFMAALLAARFALVGVLLDADGDEGGALPFAAAVEVAGFDRIEARVAVFLWIKTVEAFWSHREHP